VFSGVFKSIFVICHKVILHQVCNIDFEVLVYVAIVNPCFCLFLFCTTADLLNIPFSHYYSASFYLF